jgi:homospermidine synthase
LKGEYSGMEFPGKILVIGCGSVSQCTIPLILKLIDCPHKNITIIDFVDNRSQIKDALDKGVNYIQKKITKENYINSLQKHLKSGDLIIDLSWNIDSLSLLKWAHDNNVLYINTSVEEWNPYSRRKFNKSNIKDISLYSLHMIIRNELKKWQTPGATAIVDHGANPGLVSHFTKIALLDIANKIISEKPKDKRIPKLKEALKTNNFPALAQITGVKTIHISERDTQITTQPKEVGEFVNTWSIEGFFEEGIAPAEMGWGTHEKYVPEDACFHASGPKNQICLNRMGIKTWVRSWVPYEEIKGMVVRHGEAFSISEHLTIWNNNNAVYRPTVHYAYCPSDAAMVSLHELEMRRFNLQEKQRIIKDEIIKGEDKLGVLVTGHDFNSWWTGSILNIDEARRLVPHQNATTLQVAISVVAAAKWAIKNPMKGFLLPDEVPYEDILKIAKPYLGKFISIPVDWTPLKNHKNTFRSFAKHKIGSKDIWQFNSFLI